MIAIPTATKFFNWICTFLGNYSKLSDNYEWFDIIFFILFIVGGSSGLILGNSIVDIGLHDSYYIIAHFHFILSVGAIIIFIAALLFFVVDGIQFMVTINSTNAKHQFVITLFGVLLTFTMMHILGFNVMMRRIPDFNDYFNSWNFLSSFGFIYTLNATSLLHH